MNFVLFLYLSLLVLQANQRLYQYSSVYLHNYVCVSHTLDMYKSNGWSALFFAVDGEDATTTELLLEAGANPHLRDTVRMT